MALFLVNVDLNKNELQNAKVHILASAPGSPAEGQLYYNSTDKTVGFYTGATWVYLGRLDQLNAPTGDVSLNSHKITSLATPTTGTDAVNKTYADGLATGGVAWKNPVRAASTANGTLATAFEDGDTLDGVVLATGDRILLKDQSAGAENGVYVVAASGAPSRATDADAGSELVAATVFVEEGTANADQAFSCTTNAPITLDTTALVWVRITGLGTVTAGTGLSKSGDTISLSTPVSVANGGTNATTAAGARTSLGAPGVYSTDVGDNSSTSITVTHNLGTRDVIVQVYKAASTYDKVECDVAMATTNTVTLTFTVAPTTDQYRCVVVG